MQRWISGRLYARLISLHRAAWIRIAAQRQSAETAASPALLYAAITLFLILAILQIDLHRGELEAFGLIQGEDGVGSAWAGR